MLASFGSRICRSSHSTRSAHSFSPPERLILSNLICGVIIKFRLLNLSLSSWHMILRPFGLTLPYWPTQYGMQVVSYNEPIYVFIGGLWIYPRKKCKRKKQIVYILTRSSNLLARSRLWLHPGRDSIRIRWSVMQSLRSSPAGVGHAAPAWIYIRRLPAVLVVI